MWEECFPYLRDFGPSYLLQGVNGRTDFSTAQSAKRVLHCGKSILGWEEDNRCPKYVASCLDRASICGMYWCFLFCLIARSVPGILEASLAVVLWFVVLACFSIVQWRRGHHVMNMVAEVLQQVCAGTHATFCRIR